MEWTKIKPQHFLYTDMSMGNIGCMTVLLCLTAHLERLPTDRERVKHTHIRALRSLDEAMMKQGRTVDEAMMKVLEDSDKVAHKRSLNKDRQKRYRDKKDVGNALHNATDKSIVENKRVEKKGFTIPTLQQVSEYIKEQRYNTKPEQFMSHYEANGWKVGRNSMKCWKAAIRKWGSKDGKKPVAPSTETATPKPDPNFKRYQGGKIKDLTREIGGE